MTKITYAELAERYGDEAAHNLLLTIERLAQIKDDLSADGEARLQRVMDMLNASGSVTVH